MGSLAIASLGIFLCLAKAVADPWRHVEYGAANMGPEGESERQLEVLFLTLDRHVKERGPKGTFYVNDKTKEWADYAAEKLGEHKRAKGYSGVEIVSAPGDYFTLNPESTDTAHLKNPDMALLKRLSSSENFWRMVNASESGLEIHTTFMHDFNQLIDKQRIPYSRELGPGDPYINADKNSDFKGTEAGTPLRFLVSSSACGAAKPQRNISSSSQKEGV